jgi:hypothetical protein
MGKRDKGAVEGEKPAKKSKKEEAAVAEDDGDTVRNVLRLSSCAIIATAARMSEDIPDIRHPGDGSRPGYRI